MAKSAEEKRQYDLERRSKTNPEDKAKKIPDQLLSLVSFIKPGVTPEKVALNYAKMMRRDGFSTTGLISLNPKMFSNETIARRIIVLLRNNGMVSQLDNGRYGITTRGENAIIVLGSRDKPKHGNTQTVENNGDDW